METWKRSPIFGHLYQVSDLGKVKSRFRIMKQNQSHNGYLKITLCDNKERFDPRVHVLVAKAFIGERPEGHEINHKNGIKTDNRVANLEYVTPEENVRHRMMNGHGYFGERHHKAKITVAIAREIRSSGWTNDRHTKPSLHSLARKYSLAATTIHYILKRKIWKHC